MILERSAEREARRLFDTKASGPAIANQNSQAHTGAGGSATALGKATAEGGLDSNEQYKINAKV